MSANLPNTPCILNTGGFSRKYHEHISQIEDIKLIDIAQLAHYSPEEAERATIVVVADDKFEEFTTQVKSIGNFNVISYGQHLALLSEKPEKTPYHLINKTSKFIAICISEQSGYRKPYREVIEAVCAAGFEPVLFSHKRLNDELENNYHYIQLKSPFDIYHYARQAQLLISDANKLRSPMQHLGVPRLYVPHGFLGSFERNIELNLSPDVIFQNHSKVIFSPFNFAFLPSKLSIDFYKSVASLSSEKQDITLIPGGYINLDMAIKNCSHADNTTEQQERNAILYCPGGIPKNNLHENLPMSFPYHSADIIEALLCSFPNLDVIFRHHPGSLAIPEFRQKIEDIKLKFQHNKRFVYDDQPTHNQSFLRAKMMISDSSTSAYTYALSNLRPVHFFMPEKPNMSMEINGNRHCSLKTFLCKEISTTIEHLIKRVQTILNDEHAEMDSVKKLRDEHFFNVGEVTSYLTKSINSIVKNQTIENWEKL